MPLPQLSEQAIERSVAGVTKVLPPLRGGQRLVFPCMIGGRPFALKVMLAETRRSAVEARARREVDILQRCNSAHLVAPGPIRATLAEIEGQRVVYFTEEWIEGNDLRSILRRKGSLPFAEVALLGMAVAQAIDDLWCLRVLHRDVKPGNIMRRKASPEFLLVDLGLASVGQPEETNRRPGTRIYFSPERLNSKPDKDLDFRSDLFSLGIVLYEATTGVHPFAVPIADESEIQARIRWLNPLRPSSYRERVPMSLSLVIMRLLAKRPASRYRSGALVVRAFQEWRQHEQLQTL